MWGVGLEEILLVIIVERTVDPATVSSRKISKSIYHPRTEISF